MTRLLIAIALATAACSSQEPSTAEPSDAMTAADASDSGRRLDASPEAPEEAAESNQDGSVPTHVLTWDRYGELGIGACVPGTVDAGYPCIPPSEAARWVSWAETPPQHAWAVHDAGMHMYLYTDPSWIGASDPEYENASPADMAHTCDAACVPEPGGAPPSGGGCIARAHYADWMTDPHSPHLLTDWRQAIAGYLNYARPAPPPPYDAVMQDDAVNTYSATALPCGFVHADWESANATLIANEEAADGGLPVIYNGPFPGADPTQLGANTGLAAAAFGARLEECYIANQPSTPNPDAGCANPRPFTAGAYWQSFENNEIFYASKHQFLLCLENDTLPGADQLRERMYQFASFLLTYDLGSTLIGRTFDTPTHFRVYPEVQLVARGPLVAIRTDASQPPNWVLQLQDSGGAFAREYAQCYFAGAAIGPCAVAVNSDACNSDSLPTFRNSFGHTLAIDPTHPLDVLEGGVATILGQAPPATIPPLTGLVLTP